MFQNVVTESGANATSIATHSESRFGSQYIVLKSCVRYIDNLVALVGSQPFLKLVREKFTTAVKLHNLLSVQYSDEDGFYSRAPIFEKLCDTVCRAMTLVEADRAYLSSMLPLVKRQDHHGAAFSTLHPYLACGAIMKKGSLKSLQHCQMYFTIE
jgi:hypothetical protein